MISILTARFKYHGGDLSRGGPDRTSSATVWIANSVHIGYGRSLDFPQMPFAVHHHADDAANSRHDEATVAGHGDCGKIERGDVIGYAARKRGDGCHG